MSDNVIISIENVKMITQHKSSGAVMNRGGNNLILYRKPGEIGFLAVFSSRDSTKNKSCIFLLAVPWPPAMLAFDVAAASRDIKYNTT